VKFPDGKEKGKKKLLPVFILPSTGGGGRKKKRGPFDDRVGLGREKETNLRPSNFCPQGGGGGKRSHVPEYMLRGGACLTHNFP